MSPPVPFPRRAPRERFGTEPPPSQRVALVSGANRGLGLEVSRQLAAAGMTVLLGARQLAAGEKAAKALRRAGGDVTAVQLDVTAQADVDALAERIGRDYGRLDVLVNNAGAYFNLDERASSVDLAYVRGALDTNLLGAWRLSEAAIPFMRRHAYGRIVNVSSGCGAIDSEGEDCPAYRVSKAALNSYTRMLAAELKGSGILVNAVCPGWVATDMGGPGGRPVADGAAGIVWAASLPSQGAITGGFFRDRAPIAW
ncbi:SDR family NAD(P)-dependent oxidoreductase [Dyella sp. SG609]|uniref:SDR family NAD(P)-dependent oxidoreductase n=1 Tax=Dyella sp. SG609 TaxID=2587018 RepID=UPI0014458DA1|nr:SDR family NAD(P)-dependent oxidoreductase [Dyella sp. SG609]NKJ22594.1 NAD(P)-dependent dehydrogenase (short-subunit alcohol dehydrogenase family) [Dyella sp. SG609]